LPLKETLRLYAIALSLATGNLKRIRVKEVRVKGQAQRYRNMLFQTTRLVVAQLHEI
jgi:hypothetical protein